MALPSPFRRCSRRKLNTAAGSDPSALPVLWIESDPSEDGGIPTGHRFGLNGLRNIGYRAVGEGGAAPEGRYVFKDADELTDAFWDTVTTDNYSAIGVASTFGGILRRAELDNLNADYRYWRLVPTVRLNFRPNILDKKEHYLQVRVIMLNTEFAKFDSDFNFASIGSRSNVIKELTYTFANG